LHRERATWDENSRQLSQRSTTLEKELRAARAVTEGCSTRIDELLTEVAATKASRDEARQAGERVRAEMKTEIERLTQELARVTSQLEAARSSHTTERTAVEQQLTS